MKLKRLIHFFASFGIICSCGPKTEFVPNPLGFETDQYVSDSTKVRYGETFSTLMPRLGLDTRTTYALSQLCKDCFDVRKVIAGNQVTAFYDTLSRELRYVVYDNDRINSTIFKCTDSLAVWRYEKPVEHQRLISDVTITSSLWNDMIAAGTSPLLIVELADIYAWTVNFFGLREGDRFRSIYTQTVCEGEVVSIDSVLFCIYDSGNFHAPAIRFDQHDGGPKYWNEDGASMRKAFLKAPLRYNRISSKFSYHRKHPVTGRVRPHTGVDYAAPSGTPVHSIGDGTVTMCGWDGSGGGNRVKIRHMNGYETCYMHLRGFGKGVRVGARVSQGQTIGYVGSTGRSTGPHLDFRVWKDRKAIDPLKMISPPSKPLAKEYLDSLKSLYAAYLEELN